MTDSLNRRTQRAAVATAGRYWLPTRPYTLVDAVNRAAAATGSVRYAQLSADASYNGHSVTVTYNDYRDYCLCEHYWGGRVVHCRGSMASALRSGRREYDLGHRGTRVTTCDLTPDEAEIALSLGYIPWSKDAEEAWDALWYTELHSCVGQALSDAKWFGGDTAHLLLQASDKIDYHERRQRSHADQMFGKGKWKECRLVGPAGQRAMVLSGDRGGECGEYAMVMVDGASKLSGPTPSARTWWKAQVAAGWTVASVKIAREDGSVCPYCDQQRVGPRDECGDIDAGLCMGRAAADDHAARAGRPRTAEERERWLAEVQAPFCVMCERPLTVAEQRAERNNGDYDETCSACECV